MLVCLTPANIFVYTVFPFCFIWSLYLGPGWYRPIYPPPPKDLFKTLEKLFHFAIFNLRFKIELMSSMKNLQFNILLTYWLHRWFPLKTSSLAPRTTKPLSKIQVFIFIFWNSESMAVSSYWALTEAPFLTWEQINVFIFIFWNSESMAVSSYWALTEAPFLTWEQINAHKTIFD